MYIVYFLFYTLYLLAGVPSVVQVYIIIQTQSLSPFTRAWNYFTILADVSSVARKISNICNYTRVPMVNGFPPKYICYFIILLYIFYFIYFTLYILLHIFYFIYFISYILLHIFYFIYFTSFVLLHIFYFIYITSYILLNRFYFISFTSYILLLYILLHIFYFI